MLLKCNLAGSARNVAADHHGPLGIRILIPDGPDPCGRSGVRAPAPRSTGVTTILSASPRQPLLYVHRHGTLKPPALFHVKHVSHQACGIRCTERHYAAPEFTDSRQRRFSTKISTQTGSSSEPICYTCWSRPQAGTAFQGCHQPSKLAMRVRFPSPAPRQNAISGGRQEAVCSCSVAVGQTSGPVEEVERVEQSFVVGVGEDLERGG